MYVPSFNAEQNTQKLHQLIKSQPFGDWSALADGEIVVNHLPFLLDENKGELGTLYAHVARANPIYKTCSGTLNSVVVFHGADSYITPSWYPSKQQNGMVVPTWNYIVVHASGIPKINEDKQWLLEHLNQLTDFHESQQALPWKLSDAPETFINKLLNAIVGIEIPITQLSGKWKLGQNRSQADQQGMINGLNSQNNINAIALAEELIQSNK